MRNFATVCLFTVGASFGRAFASSFSLPSGAYRPEQFQGQTVSLVVGQLRRKKLAYPAFNALPPARHNPSRPAQAIAPRGKLLFGVEPWPPTHLCVRVQGCGLSLTWSKSMLAKTVFLRSANTATSRELRTVCVLLQSAPRTTRASFCSSRNFAARGLRANANWKHLCGRNQNFSPRVKHHAFLWSIERM